MNEFTLENVAPLTADLFALIEEGAERLGRDEAIRQAGLAVGIAFVSLGAPGGAVRMQELIAVHAQAAKAGMNAASQGITEAVIASNGGRQ